MAAIRKTCFWMLFLLLIAAAGGGGYAYWFWSQSDELVRQALQDKLQEASPDWDVTVPDARIDWWGRVRVYDVSLKDRENHAPTFALPETIIVLDREQLVDQQLVIQQVRLLRPELQLIRDRGGRWNLEGFKPPPQSPLSQPEVFVERGALTVRVTFDDGRLSPPVTFRDLNLELIPTGKRRYRLKSDFQLAQTGTLAVDGEFDLDAGTWEATGALRQFRIDDDIVKQLAAYFPQQLRELSERAVQFMASKHFAAADQLLATQTDAAVGEPTLEQVLAQFSLLARIDATADAAFQVKQWKRGAPLQYGANVVLSKGRVNSLFLPYELHDFGGQISLNNTHLTARGVTARNGRTQLAIDGKCAFQDPDLPMKFDVRVTDLAIDDRLRNCAPTTWHKFYDETRPGGDIDVVANLEFDRVNRWKHKTTVEIKNGTAQHVKFPYPVRGVRGIVVQEGPLLTADLKALAGERVATITAEVRHPGPLAESTVTIDVDDLPFDRKLYQACNPAAQKVISQLNLRGAIDARLVLYRPPGPGNKHRPDLQGRLKNCAVSYEHFPYELKQVNGRVEWDAEDWFFEELTATHGAARLAATGSFRKSNGGLLDMVLTAVDVKFEDEDFYYALPDALQQVADQFQAQGRFDMIGTHITWTPGTLPVVNIRQLDLKNNSLKLREFPYPFHNVEGRVSIVNNPQLNRRDIILHRLTAKHGDDKNLKLNGLGYILPDGEWHVSFEELNVDDLDTGHRFRKALPAGVRSFFEATDPRGHSISVDGQLALRGTPNGRNVDVTARWDVNIYHSGTTITAGTDLKDLFGRVHLAGSWDGETIYGTGWLDLDSATINGYQLTEIKGPMNIQHTQFIIGSKEIASGQPAEGPGAPDDRERVTAEFIGGKLVLDGIATLDEKNGYRIMVQIKDGRVERYTQLYAPKQKNLRGIVNGSVLFTGYGADPNSFEGQGQLRIYPAALYELPVILQITKALSFLPPDKTAFDNAYASFRVTNRGYNFQRIDLMGDAVSLRGFGWMTPVDGRLNLDFYSTVPRNQLPVPIVGQLVGGITEGWIHVKVTGTTTVPNVQQNVVPRLDGAIKSVLGIIGPQPPPRPTNARGNRNAPRR